MFPCFYMIVHGFIHTHAHIYTQSFFLTGMNFIYYEFNWCRKIKEILRILLIMIKRIKKISLFIKVNKYGMPLSRDTNFSFLISLPWLCLYNFCPIISTLYSFYYNLWLSSHVSTLHLFILLGHFPNFISQPKYQFHKYVFSSILN